MLSRSSIVFKSLSQLGPEPLLLNALYRFGLWTGHYKRTEAKALDLKREAPALHSLFSFPLREDLLQTLGRDGKAELLTEADEIVKGKVRLFGAEPVPLKLTFSEPLHHWTDYETGKTPIPESQFPIHQSANLPIPDIKFLWEPARFGWAFTLGRAYYLTKLSKSPSIHKSDPAEKYAEAFWKYFEKFDEGNPPYLGPNWMNGQEVALRLMALVWSAQVFEGASASNPPRRKRIIQSIWEHAIRLPSTLVYARSQNNNHLVTESTALFTAGVALDLRSLCDLGWRWLNYSLQHQISSFGEYTQHSTNYHRLMLQTVLWVDAILRGPSHPSERWQSRTLESLMRASHWLFSMLSPASGRTPNLGANDGALILPLSSSAFNDFRPTVQAAARAFLRTGLPAGQWDELSLWLGLPASKHTADSDVYATDHLRGRNSWAFLRASSFKSRLTHMDQLHLDLWWRGLNVMQDAGTYLYNAGTPWDNPLVSTRVHNTVTVDGCDQMTRAGRFLILDWVSAYSKRVLATDENVLGRIIAYHKGYRRLGILHERLATVYTDERWQIQDNLIFNKSGEHLFRLHWLLPDWKYEILKKKYGIRLKSPHGWITVSITPDSRIPVREFRMSLVRAGKIVFGTGEALPFEGWASPSYGQKIPALSLALEVTTNREFSFLTEVIFPKPG